MKYECSDCGMSVKGLTCGQCGEPLQNRKAKNSQGQDIQVAECPKSCGKIKSPTCCGHDMETTA